MSGAITPGAALTADHERACDVAIVGSGAGGAVLAAGLAEAGLDVVMIEEGGAYTRADFTLQDEDAFRTMYQDQGLRQSSDGAIAVLQGRNFGGGTTVNWTTCYRTPPRILEHWQRVHGLDGLDEASLAPHFEAVERRLNIHLWSEVPSNRNNQIILDGAAALGWEAARTRRNVKGCANSGYCGHGCPMDAKQAMHLTYLPDALAAGMDAYADARASRLELERDRVVAIHAELLDRATRRPTGVRLKVRPKVAVVSGGAINSPALLLRSGVNPNGRVGCRTFLHPVVPLVAQFERYINGFSGAPQSAASHQHIDRGPDRIGFFIEVAPVFPMLLSMGGGWIGEVHRQLMAELPHAGLPLALAVDGLLPGDEGGRVRVERDGRLRVDYPIGAALQEAFHAGHVALAELVFAAGAGRAMTTHTRADVLLSSKADIPMLDDLPYGAGEHAIFTAHQMGGCAMGGDPKRSVVDSQHRVRGTANLFVVDGSVLPTALGVNPSETIYGIAHRAREFVAAAV